MKKKQRNYSTNVLILAVLVLAVILFAYSGNYITALAADEWNTSTTQVSESQQPPEIGIVTLTDGDGNIDLTANSTTTVTCWAEVNDPNGNSDIINGNVVIYDSNSVGSDCTENTRNCYKNTSFTDACTPIDNNDTAVNCSFTVDMYFNAINSSSWVCNMTIEDSSGNSDSENSPSETVGKLIAIDINASIMDFGIVSPGNYGDVVVQKIYNTGNVIFDLQLNGTDMNCTQGEDIGVSNITYNLTEQIEQGNPGQYELTGELVTRDFNLHPNESSTEPPTPTSSNTWWTIYMPISSGEQRQNCNGTVWFIATENL